MLLQPFGMNDGLCVIICEIFLIFFVISACYCAVKTAVLMVH